MGKKKEEKKSKSRKKKPHDTLPVEDLAPLLTQAARSLRTALSRKLAETGLYAGQDGVILSLSTENGLTTGQLAQRLGVKAPTMTRTVGRMEAQGFLERRIDETDGRLVKVHLTESGRQTVERIASSISSCSAEAMKDFSDKEIRVLFRLLSALDRNLQSRIPARPQLLEPAEPEEE